MHKQMGYSINSLSIMATPFTNSKHRLLRCLFFIFEGALLGSSLAYPPLVNRYHRAHLIPHGGLLAAAWLASLVMLLAVSHCLRRTARPLAIIGWLTAFGSFALALLSPDL